MSQTVYVLLGDLEQSRKAEGRRLLQRRLDRICVTLNRDCSASILAPLKPLKGIDEVGGVLVSVDRLYHIVDVFRRDLRPSRMRIAVASGIVDVGGATRDTARMDGPAFHRAARAMADLKESGLGFVIDADEPGLDAAVSGLTTPCWR